jgi:hypothetical protein
MELRSFLITRGNQLPLSSFMVGKIACDVINMLRSVILSFCIALNERDYFSKQFFHDRLQRNLLERNFRFGH